MAAGEHVAGEPGPGEAPAGAPDHVRLEVTGAVATIRLDRPPMNALSRHMQQRIGELAAQVAADPAVRAVVLYGGPKVFAAGADVTEMVGQGYADVVRWSGVLQDSFAALARIPKPVVAAVNGYALGGGCELALCADRRICADDARLGQPEVLLGLIPGAGGTQRLARLVGPARAKDLVFTGRFVGAAEALAIGLVDEVVAPADVYAAALAWAGRFAAGPALALRAAKHAIDRGLDGDLGTGLALESDRFAALFATDDAAAGLASFVANGPGKARFTGH